jgi:hypothetical protein
MDTSSTIPEKTGAKSVVLKRSKSEKLTPSGYPAGGLRASDGTLYEVKPSGQIVRREPKRSKAELKRHKKARRGPGL